MKKTIGCILTALLLHACGGKPAKTELDHAIQMVAIESARFAAEPTHGDVMLLGDSVTFELGGAVRTYTDPVSGETTTVVNRAIPGNRVECLEYELGAHVYAEQPKGVIIAVGINNILFNSYWLTPDQFIQLYEQVIDDLQAHGIWVQVRSVLPVSSAWAPPGLIQEYDDKIKAMAARKGCAYYNTYPFLADGNGELLAEYSLDGVHLNDSGLAVYTQHFFDL